MDRFAPPEDPIELYKYDHINERGTLKYRAELTWLRIRTSRNWIWKAPT